MGGGNRIAGALCVRPYQRIRDGAAALTIDLEIDVMGHERKSP